MNAKIGIFTNACRISKSTQVADAKRLEAISRVDSAVAADLIPYLELIGAREWEIFGARKNEQGFQNYFGSAKSNKVRYTVWNLGKL